LLQSESSEAVPGLIAAAADFDLKYKLTLQGEEGAKHSIKALSSASAAKALVVSELLPSLDPFVSPLLVEACYDKLWEIRLGACFGIRVMLERMPAKWSEKNASAFLPGVLHVLKVHCCTYYIYCLAHSCLFFCVLKKIRTTIAKWVRMLSFKPGTLCRRF